MSLVAQDAKAGFVQAAAKILGGGWAAVVNDGQVHGRSFNKWPGETQREWGRTITMDAEVQQRMDRIFAGLGL